MKDILPILLEDDLAALAGLRIKGIMPVREALANKILKELMEDRSAKAAAPASEKEKAVDPKPADALQAMINGQIPDPRMLLKHFRQLEVKMREGRMEVHFDLFIADKGGPEIA